MGNGGSREHLLLLFIARLVVPTKVLELCGSKIQFTKAYHAESKEVQHRSGHYAGVCCSTGQIDSKNTSATPGISTPLSNRNESNHGSTIVRCNSRSRRTSSAAQHQFFHVPAAARCYADTLPAIRLTCIFPAARHATTARHAAAPRSQSRCYFTAATAHQHHVRNCTHCLHGIGKVV